MSKEVFGIIDCGTTNTRVYLVDGEKIIGTGEEKVGVRDTALNGSNNVIKEGLKKAFDKAIENAQLSSINEIKYAVASGMITSELGLVDLPHIIAPAGINELSENAVVINDKDIFPFDMPIIFVRGIKNNYGENAKVNDIRSMDFMRGEEVQVMGALRELKPQLPVNIVFLSSHTKVVNVNKEGKIEGSITTISGQFFESLKHTSIYKSIENIDSTSECSNYKYEEIADIAYDCVHKSGFLRTMLMPRFMQNLLTTNSEERRLFVDSAIASDDIKIIEEFVRQGFDTKTDYILIGHKNRCKLYSYFIKNYIDNKSNISCVSDKEQIKYLTVSGALEVSKLKNIELFK